jgi:hypothetical protein
MIIRSFYHAGERLELSREMRSNGRSMNGLEPLSAGFFAGTVDRHVFVAASPRGPCLGFDGHLVILDAGTQLALRRTAQGRTLVVARGGQVVAELPAPEPDDHVDGDDDVNDFFLWLVGRFGRPEARAAYTV